MNFNRKFPQNIWDTPRPVHPIPPFVNQQQNFYQNQGNFQQQFPNQNFHQNFHQQTQNQNIRPLLSLPTADHQPPFRKFNNNNNHHQDYRRPGPACARNNYHGNNPNKWSKNNQREDFNNRESRPSDTFENHNNNSRPSDVNIEPTPSPSMSDVVPKFKSLVEQLKAVQNSKKNDGDSSRSNIDAICVKNASETSRKLLTQLKTMDKDGVKDLINNPKQVHKKVALAIQAREKRREEVRKKLKQLGTEGDVSDFQLEPDECIDYEKIPESLIAQIGKTIDMNLDIEDMDLSESIEDRDIEVVTQNLGNDFLMGSEMLLMNGFSLLAETDNESDLKGLDDSMSRLPPLPAELHDKPPSPPPEPVSSPLKPPEEKAAFSSIEKPWSPIRLPRPAFTDRFIDDEWDIESAKNPDPPSATSFKDAPPMSTPRVSFPSTPRASVPSSSNQQKSSEVVENTPVIDVPVVEEKAEDAAAVAPKEAPAVEQNSEPQQPSESGQRANETYGDYKRRLALERSARDTEWDDCGSSFTSNNNNNRPQNDFNRSQAQKNQQNQRKGNDKNNGGNNSNWMVNNRRNNNDQRNINNQNQQQDRKSRFEIDRGRDRNRNNNNNFQQRNASRDTNNSYDSGRQDKFDDVKDVHNYRFQNEKNTQEPVIDRLNTMLNPKPLQFKGSFNKRSQQASTSSYRVSPNRGRNQTPVNNSVERDFDENLLPSPNDARPCLTTLRKVMEIDAEISKLHDKVLGIDKVISNLQSERIGYQKSFSRLQHDRKVLFDNMMKRAMSNADEADSPVAKDKSESREPSTSQRSANEKKLQSIVDQKKRKHEEQPEEPKKKKVAPEVVETTSAAEKAAQRQKEKEEEERRQKIAEKKRLKKLRKEREGAERQRNEERARKEAAALHIKQEPREKSEDKSKTNKPSSKVLEKPKELKKILFRQSEIIKIENFKKKMPSIKLQRVTLAQNLVDTYKSSGWLEINIDDWHKWCKPMKPEVKVKKEEEKPVKAKSPEVADDPLAVPESNVDPLAMDESSMNPPTPGSNLTSNEDSMLVEVQTEQDYAEWTGNFTTHEAPIVHLCNIHGKYVVAATEDGKVFKYHLSDGKLAAVFSKHTEICNSFLFDDRGSIYTVSSDGFLHKIKFKNFQLIASENFNEPLQVIEKSKAGIYVGTKTGKIFRLKPDLTEHETDPICDLGALILCMRAAKEGSRNILLVSSRTHAIQVRDANDGLLLRTLSSDLIGLSIYDMLIEGSTIYCGSNRHEIFSIDFTTGALKKSRPCGAGAICVKLYKHYLIAACYDGNIYIFNTKNDDAAVNICGPSNMLLAMDLWDNKIIASTKDKTMKIMNIPT